MIAENREVVFPFHSGKGLPCPNNICHEYTSEGALEDFNTAASKNQELQGTPGIFDTP